jgi:EAL domain-containing protein (putative c-di-GMP-specific phosphodiesterase class I)
MPDSNPAKWLSDQLVRVASATHGQSIGHRPILVPAPLAALAHSNTAVACDAAIRRTSLCQQEICLEFADAAFAGGVTDYVSRVGLLRRHGFRIAIDMRRSWQTPMNDALRLLVDTIRIDARAIDTNPDLVEIVEVADASGILIVAEHAHWRDGEYLADLGIHAASRPKADA